MKIGVRKRSFKRSLKAKTTGKLKRKVKKAANPFYGKKGMGYVKNPKKALYNKVYRKTTIDSRKLYGSNLSGSKRKSSGKRRQVSNHPTKNVHAASSVNNNVEWSPQSIYIAFLLGFIVLSFFIPVLWAIVAGMILYKFIVWFKNSKRYSVEQIQKISAVLPSGVTNNGAITSAKLVRIVNYYLDSLPASIAETQDNMQAASIDDFFMIYQKWINDVTILDTLKSINAEPKEYISTLNMEAASFQISMITRTFEKEIQSASVLKTDKGKQNRYKKYFEKLNNYKETLLPEAQDKIIQFKRKIYDIITLKLLTAHLGAVSSLNADR